MGQPERGGKVSQSWVGIAPGVGPFRLPLLPKAEDGGQIERVLHESGDRAGRVDRMHGGGDKRKAVPEGPRALTSSRGGEPLADY